MLKLRLLSRQQLIRGTHPCQAARDFSKDDNQDPMNRPPPKYIQMRNTVPAYKHDPKVDLILRTMARKSDKEKPDSHEAKNEEDKEFFNMIIKNTALELRSKYKQGKHNKTLRQSTVEVMEYLAKNLDGRSFTILNKLLTELRSDVLNNKYHSMGPDSFNTFLMKVADLNPISKQHGHAIITQLQDVDISMMTPSALMEQY